MAASKGKERECEVGQGLCDERGADDATALRRQRWRCGSGCANRPVEEKEREEREKEREGERESSEAARRQGSTEATSMRRWLKRRWMAAAEQRRMAGDGTRWLEASGRQGGWQRGVGREGRKKERERGAGWCGGEAGQERPAGGAAGQTQTAAAPERR